MRGFVYKDNPDEYIVACMVGSNEVQNNFVTWPSHITVIPWFEIEKDSDAVAVMQRIETLQSRFKILITGEDKFGPRRTVPVYSVYSPSLEKVHNLLMDELENAKADLPFSGYSRSNYKPHITKKRDKRFQLNDQLLIDKLYLVAAPKDQDRRFRAKRLVHKGELQHETAA